MSSTISLFPYRAHTRAPRLLYPWAMVQRDRLHILCTMKLTIYELVTIHDGLRILGEEWQLHKVPGLDEQVEIIAQRLAAVLSQNGVG